jgi:hypothetical protein
MKKLLSLFTAHGALLVVAVPLLVLVVPSGADVAIAQEAAADTTTQAVPPAQETQQMAAAEEVKQSPAKQSKAGFFGRGRVRTGFVVGVGNSFNNTYLILGVGAGYYLVNGLEVGANVQGWLLNTPTIWQVSPEVRYVVWQLPKFKPYAGLFYRWNFMQDFDTVNSYGGRLGVFYQSNPRMYMGVGAVWEEFSDCGGNGLSDCSNVYPEFVVSMGF